MQHESKIGHSFAGTLGVEVFRLMQVAMGFKAEAAGFRLSAKVPAMSTIAKRDYGITIKRTREAKADAAKFFTSLAAELDRRINADNVANLEGLNQAELVRALLD